MLHAPQAELGPEDKGLDRYDFFVSQGAQWVGMWPLWVDSAHGVLRPSGAG